MMSMLIIFMSTMTIMFMFMKHPLSMGIILLLQTILVTLLTGLMNYNFWFSYIIFLIMIGGMLILFIYMTSIASNKKFKLSSLLLLVFFISLTLNFVFQVTDQFLFSLPFSTMDFYNQNFFINNYLTLNKYFNYPNNMVMYMMIIYLLITLIMTVKITKMNKGPLRQMY
uniref:NADH-ubiquinone oxidoreductase chain 6 n=1 Tax=Acanthoscelides obtectus TaxID=200917 RepID=A0A343D0L4_ACAOB|nr:NADH dehydrogenase subunit 6 [Acanthoscelides obtectus]ARR75265.1 NADH dehydrogenase subunit 6 [Acanthoscelides obtectus]ATL15485.1 NADH dehydrogenase subunit 6 [Acanthoscelides obtectus]